MPYPWTRFSLGNNIKYLLYSRISIFILSLAFNGIDRHMRCSGDDKKYSSLSCIHNSQLQWMRNYFLFHGNRESLFFIDFLFISWLYFILFLLIVLKFIKFVLDTTPLKIHFRSKCTLLYNFHWMEFVPYIIKISSQCAVKYV